MQTIKLNNGIDLPILGFGTLQITDPLLCEKCIYEAIKCGYRMFDTAASYGNEEAIGKGIKSAIRDRLVTREELFITTKLWIQDTGIDSTRRALMDSLKKLELEYIDMYLIHHPFGDYYASWRVMEQMVDEGLIKTIGICNFSGDKLVDLYMNSRIKPAVNQIEIHPFFNQKEAIHIMRQYKIHPQAWGPLSEAQRDIFNNELLVKIGAKYKKSAAQVILRWHIENGISVIPKTIHKERMMENMDIWDFKLNDDKKIIDKLNIGESEIIDFKSPCTAKWLNKWKIHD